MNGFVQQPFLFNGTNPMGQMGNNGMGMNPMGKWEIMEWE